MAKSKRKKRAVKVAKRVEKKPKQKVKKPASRRTKKTRVKKVKPMTPEVVVPAEPIKKKKTRRGRLKKELTVVVPEAKHEAEPDVEPEGKPEVRLRGRRKKVEEERPPEIFETSGGMRKKYFIVLEEETHMAFGLAAYRSSQHTPVLMNQIVKMAADSKAKFSRKDVESWMDDKTFDDGTDDKEPDAKIIRPYNPGDKPYNRIRKRYICAVEESAVERFRKNIKTHLYGCYLINHLMREYLLGRLSLTWGKKEQEESPKWLFKAEHEPIDYGEDIIPYGPGDAAALVTHEWKAGLLPKTHPEEQRARQGHSGIPIEEEDIKEKKPRRKRTLACPYPGCEGRAVKHVNVEDKTDIYYICQKCKKTFTRTAPKKDVVPKEPEDEK